MDLPYRTAPTTSHALRAVESAPGACHTRSTRRTKSGAEEKAVITADCHDDSDFEDSPFNPFPAGRAAVAAARRGSDLRRQSLAARQSQAAGSPAVPTTTRPSNADVSLTGVVSPRTRRRPTRTKRTGDVRGDASASEETEPGDGSEAEGVEAEIVIPRARRGVQVHPTSKKVKTKHDEVAAAEEGEGPLPDRRARKPSIRAKEASYGQGVLYACDEDSSQIGRAHV